MDARGEGLGSDNPSCFYSLLGIRRDASASDIRSAYRKLALKWHPDRWAKDPTAAGEAKRRFQRIQEAYSVLSDEGKRAMYDVGLYDPLEDNEEEDISDFVKDFMAAVDRANSEPPSTFEEIQGMFNDLVNNIGMDFGGKGFASRTRSAH